MLLKRFTSALILNFEKVILLIFNEMIEQKKKFCVRQLSDNNKNCFNMTKCIPLNDFLLFLLQKIIIQTSRTNN